MAGDLASNAETDPSAIYLLTRYEATQGSSIQDGKDHGVGAWSLQLQRKRLAGYFAVLKGLFQTNLAPCAFMR